MNENIIDFEATEPHVVRELICIRCKKRFIDVAPEGVLLKDLVCPKCKRKGYLICTGQELEKV